MELPDAQKEFMEILHRAKNPDIINSFLSWVKENWFNGTELPWRTGNVKICFVSNSKIKFHIVFVCF